MKLPFWATRVAAAGIVIAGVRSALADATAEDAARACLQGSDQGQVDRDAGKYRAARVAFAQCAQEACPPAVKKVCTQWLRELDGTAPTVVLGARDEQGSDVADVTVTLDGEPFTTKLDGRPIEVDSGEHLLRFERPGSTPVEQKIIFRAGEKARVVNVVLRSAAAAQGTSPEGPSEETEPTPPEPEPLASPRHLTAAGLLVAGLGAAGVGVYFAVRAGQDGQNASNMRAGLPTNACVGASTPSCQSLSDTVQSQHAETNAATVLFVGGGVLAAGAIATWLLWPTSSTATGPTSSWIVPVDRGAVLGLSGRLP
jgi:hypothetical protein